MQGNKHKANIVLAVAAASYLLAVPFEDSFVGGLLAAAFGAATIGGAADWFAVTALFRRPLGISFKTAVIPRNRARISREMVDMVQNRLLTKENIYSKIVGYDMTALLLDFLKQGGKSDILEAIPTLLRDFMLRIKPQELGDFIIVLLRENTGKLSLAAQLAIVVDWSNRQGYTEKVLDFILTEAQKLMSSQSVYKLIYELIAMVRQTYAGERTERKLADWLFNQGGFTPERLAEIIQEKLLLFLSQLNQPDNAIRGKVLAYFSAMPARLRSSAWQEKIEVLQTKFLADKDLVAGLARFIRQQAGESTDLLARLTASQLERAFKYIAEDKAAYKMVDDYLTQALVILVEKYHGKIGALAAKRLEQYTAEEMSALIEHKVSNDLQMIRLNGSTVGAFTGMLIFLLTYFWQ